MADVHTAGRAASAGRLLSDDLSFLIARTNALSIAAGNAALAEFGLKVRSYAVLVLAAETARYSQREIADFLRLDPSQVVPLVDELQRSGLISREPDPRDRRANVIATSAAGDALLEHARVAVYRAERELHSELTKEERASLAVLLRKTAFPSL